MRRGTRQKWFTVGTVAIVVGQFWASCAPGCHAGLQEQATRAGLGDGLPPNPVLVFLAAEYWITAWLAVGLGILGTLVGGWPRSSRSAVKTFLDHVHERSFPGVGAIGRDPHYRVSLWVPVSIWRCWYRTDKPHWVLGWSTGFIRCYWRTDRVVPRSLWRKIPDDGSDGVVGHVWKWGVIVKVKSPSKEPTPEEIRVYLTEAHVSEEANAAMGWPFAALLGVPVRLQGCSNPYGVLIVESDLPSKSIDLDNELLEDAILLQKVWDGSL